MAVEFAGGLPEDSEYPYPFADEQTADLDTPAEGPFMPDDESAALPDGEDYAEAAASSSNDITVSILDRVFEAGTELASQQSRKNTLNDQMVALSFELDALDDSMVVAERSMRHVLLGGRKELWEATAEGSQYAVGAEVIANAVRLSPEIDEVEPVPLREARVGVISRLSNAIEADVPTLVVRWMQHSAAHARFHAAVPTHDGFSLALKEDSYYSLGFALGINGNTIVPIVDATVVEIDEATPNDLRPENVRPLIEVYTGEDVATYAADVVTTKTGAVTLATQTIKALGGTNEQTEPVRAALRAEKARREGEQQDLVGIITAVRQIETPLSLDADVRRQAVDAISEYLFIIDGRDSDNHRVLLDAGYALQYIYPADAPKSLADFLVGKINERTLQRHGPHYAAPVISVLQEVCNIRGAVPPGLLLN